MRRSKSFEKDTPCLYLIATPIGNLKEFTPRAIEVLKDIDYVACEDTRNTKKLLAYFNLSPHTFSLREHNEAEASLKVISLLLEGKKVAYLSDAGYPAISDPGKILVKKVREQGINVSTISGSNAALNALVASSLDSNHFYFHGFLSSKDKEAQDELYLLKNKKETLIFYESPHRIKRTLTILKDVLGDRKICLARELTKINEEYIEGTLSELLQIDDTTLIGEMVLIVEGSKDSDTISDDELLKRIQYLQNKDIRTKDIADIVSYEFNVNKNYIYDLIVNQKK